MLILLLFILVRRQTGLQKLQQIEQQTDHLKLLILAIPDVTWEKCYSADGQFCTSEHRLSDATAVTLEADTARDRLHPYVKLMLNIAD